ncbi:hypothetical protein ACFSL4_24805 [Streptomyces caeni]|uniref:Big-1 domain-containing protein n=1 Tax=Streptomyces caeni TaxID=2307231 RepID=A0ABW4IVY1_9ACTN
MVSALTPVSGDGQKAERAGRFAPLAVRATGAGDAPAGGQVVSFYVDDAQGTGTDFHGGSPVMVTTDENGIGLTDVPLNAGHSPGTVRIRAMSGAAQATFTVEVV